MAIVGSPERFKLSRVVSRTFSVLSRNAVVFLSLSALFLIPILLMNIFSAHDPAVLGRATGHASLATLLDDYKRLALTFLPLTLCTYFLQASVIQGTITYLNRGEASLGESLSVGLLFIVPIIVISILNVLGVTLGLILLVVPGVILALAWSVAIPVKVAENADLIQTFRRNRAQTKGYRWQILALSLMYFLLLIVLSLVVNLAIGISFFPSDAIAHSLSVIIWNWAERAVMAAITTVGIASTYFELRLVKEGISAENLAQVFD